MLFSEFVESVIETPICYELKYRLDKWHEFYTKDPEKCMFYLQSLRVRGRGSAKSDLLVLLPLLLETYRKGD